MHQSKTEIPHFLYITALLKGQVEIAHTLNGSDCTWNWDFRFLLLLPATSFVKPYHSRVDTDFLHNERQPARYSVFTDGHLYQRKPKQGSQNILMIRSVLST